MKYYCKACKKFVNYIENCSIETLNSKEGETLNEIHDIEIMCGNCQDILYSFPEEFVDIYTVSRHLHDLQTFGVGVIVELACRVFPGMKEMQNDVMEPYINMINERFDEIRKELF